jgi:hypothetical protein
MRTKTTVWYTLGEAGKATGIPRTRLDHACRVDRLPYRRTEAGARLLSHDVVEKLRKDGLKSFPRPYDPVASSNEQVAGSAGVTQAVGPTAQRERVEQKRGELEEMRIDRDLRQQREKDRLEKTESRAAPQRNDKLKLRNARRHSAKDNSFAWRKHARPKPAIVASNGKLPGWTMP